MLTETNLTCPKCGEKQKATMPTNACQHFYKCQKCALFTSSLVIQHSLDLQKA